MNRVLVGLLTLAATFAAVLGADPYIDINALEAGGFTGREVGVTVDQFGGMGGCVVDPTDHDAFYYYDGLEIRRYDQADGTDAAFATPPAPQSFGNARGGVYGSFLAFDPNDAQLLYFGESSDNTIRRYAISAGDRTQVSADVLFYSAPGFKLIYDIAFDISETPARMYLSESQGFGAPNNIVYIDRTGTSIQRQEIGEMDGPSGSIDTDINGDLYYAFPQGDGPSGVFNQVDMVRWTKGQVDSAIANTTGPELTDVPAQTGTPVIVRSVSFNAPFNGYGSILVRNEGGNPIIYGGNNELGTISRIDVNNSANDDLSWATSVILTDGVNFLLEPGNLSTTSKTALFGANEGQYDEIGGQASASIYAGFVYRQPSSTGMTMGAVAQIRPNSQIGEVDSLALLAQPTSVTVNKGFNMRLELRDAGGRRITTGTASRSGGITSTLNGSGSLQGPDPYGGFPVTSSISNGLLTLANFRVDTVQTGFTISFQHTGSGEMATSLAIDATAPGTRLVGLTQPDMALTNTPFSVTARIENAGGSIVTSGADATAAVTVSVLTGNGQLYGTTTVNAVDGLATFDDLRYPVAESGVTFAFDSTGMTQGSSGSVTFTPGVASVAVVDAAPNIVAPGGLFSVAVNVRDASGNRITSGDHATVDVTVSLVGNNGTLTGTLTQSTIAGAAVFSDLSIAEIGAYQLQFDTVNNVTGMSESFIVAFASSGGKNNDSCSISVGSGDSGSIWLALLGGLCTIAFLMRKRRAA